MALQEAFDPLRKTLTWQDRIVKTNEAVFVFCSDLESEQRHLSEVCGVGRVGRVGGAGCAGCGVWGMESLVLIAAAAAAIITTTTTTTTTTTFVTTLVTTRT